MQILYPSSWRPGNTNPSKGCPSKRSPQLAVWGLKTLSCWLGSTSSSPQPLPLFDLMNELPLSTTNGGLNSHGQCVRLLLFLRLCHRHSGAQQYKLRVTARNKPVVTSRGQSVPTDAGTQCNAQTFIFSAYLNILGKLFLRKRRKGRTKKAQSFQFLCKEQVLQYSLCVLRAL